MRFQFFIYLFLFPFIQVLAQKPGAVVSGRILDENETPLAKTSVILLGRETGLVSSDSGTFRMHVPADKAFALVFSHAGYKSIQQNFTLNDQGRRTNHYTDGTFCVETGQHNGHG